LPNIHADERSKNGGGWVPGQSGNPAGRPIGSRQKIANQLLADLEDVWREKGKSVLHRLAIDDPKALAQIAYGLLPRDIFVRVEDNTAIAGEDRRMLLALLDVVKEAGAEAGSPELVFQWISEDLRARLALPVQLKSDQQNHTDEGSKWGLC
jgi:hypothetical protein